MNKLDRNYDDYQAIEIIDKKLIKDFIEKHLPISEEDILKFNNFKHLLEISNIKSIDFYSYISIDEDLEYTFIFNDDTRRNFYLEKEHLLNWLTNNNLIK